MAKKIANDLVESFIKDSIALEKLQLKVAAAKFKLRKLEKNGYEHPLLRFEEKISWRPDWKKITNELLVKFMKQGPRTLFLKNLRKRFPSTHGKVGITILAPRYVEFRESMKELKERYGLISVRDE